MDGCTGVAREKVASGPPVRCRVRVIFGIGGNHLKGHEYRLGFMKVECSPEPRNEGDPEFFLFGKELAKSGEELPAFYRGVGGFAWGGLACTSRRGLGAAEVGDALFVAGDECVGGVHP